MKKKRDAKTGQYISEEQSLERDPSTWIEETEFDKGTFLEKIFESLMYKSFNNTLNERVVRVNDIEKLFRKHKEEISMNNVFINKLNKLLKGLIYISEIDSEVKPFLSGKVSDVNKDIILLQTNHSPYEQVEELDFEEFFDKLIKIENWFTDEDIERSNKFSKLKSLLENHLDKIKIFKIGKVTKNIYIVGCDPEGNLMGVQLVVVET